MKWSAPSVTFTSYTVTVLDDTLNLLGTPVTESSSATSYTATGLVIGHAYRFVVTAFNGGTSIGATTSNEVLAIQASSTSSSSGTTSSTSSGTSQATVGTVGTSDYIKAVATGQGQVIVSSYSSNPLSSVVSSVSGTTAYDVRVTPGSSFSAIDITVCGVAGGSVEWYNATTGRLESVSPAPVATSPAGCYDVHLTPTSSPTSLESSLFGTVFLVVPPSVTPPSSGGGGYTVTTPGPVTNVVAAYSAGSLKVTWNAPSNDGGSPITSYLATASPGGEQCTTTSTSCTFTNLAIGTSYTFAVVARNAAGAGAASPPSAQIVAALVPSAPSLSVVSSANSSVLVSVSAPASDGGSAITSYTVTASPGGATCVVTLPATSCEVTNLVNGTPYTFTAVATNVAGNSPVSPIGQVATPLVTTSQPENVKVTSGTRGVLISWSVPTQSPNVTGTLAASRYLVSTTVGLYACVANHTTTCLIVGLVPGVTYQFQVQVLFSDGVRGAPVLSAPVTLPRSKPATISHVFVSHNAHSVTLSASEKTQLRNFATVITLNGYRAVRVVGHSNAGANANVRRVVASRWVRLVARTLRADLVALHTFGPKVTISVTSGAFAHGAQTLGRTLSRVNLSAR
ncbi:MAG: hypothetical protein B7X07_06935 [Actinobacteria bacterium 21-64-8]|nr:MAG: hypothetical protein B7X07_06935 [Actinobacteria bacterium 21-64-8]